MGGDGDSLNNDAIKVVDACFCMYDGCIFEGCIGCMGSTKMCCCEYEFCCKSGTDMLMCGCCAIRCEAPKVCIKAQAQVCCCVEAVAIPCDEEVPCMFGTLGLICYPSVGCCRTLGEIKGVKGDEVAEAEASRDEKTAEERGGEPEPEVEEANEKEEEEEPEAAGGAQVTEAEVAAKTPCCCV